MWWERTSSKQTTGFVILPRSGFLRIPTSLSQSPILSRIAARSSKAGKAVFTSAVFGTLGAVRAYAARQQVVPFRFRPEEMDRYQVLHNDISDALKRKQSKHLIQRGYAPLAPTTESLHFEQSYSPEKMYQIVQTQGKNALKEKLKKDYFNTLDSEKNRIAQLQKEGEKLAQLQEEQQKILAQPFSWWQRLTGFRQQQSLEQKELGARRIQIQEQINSSKRIIQETTPKLQAISAQIDAALD